MKKNPALYNLISFALVLVSGCYHARTSVGEVSSDPFNTDINTADATVTCRAVRNAQDNETVEEAFALAERVGLMASTRETPISVRSAVATTCELDDAHEAAGESRAVTTREGCERLLAADGIPADAEISVTSTDRALVDPRLADAVLPMVQMRLLFASFMSDAQAWCRSQEAGTAVFAPGMGFAPGFPGTGYAPLFASGGLGASVFGLSAGIGATSGGMSVATVHARGDIVVSSYSMRTDAIALVSLNGVSTPIPSGTRDMHLRPAIGSTTTMWSVDCTINGAPMPTLRQSGAFGIDGGRLELDVICGRW